MGFCIFNNVAVAARHAVHEHGAKRVAIIDFDVHHGNGTEDIFSDDDHVLMASIFQHPFYPYSGTEDPAPNMRNVPLAAGSGGKELRRAVTEVWLPALEEFEPQLVFFSAGFDAHVEDDMAMLRFTDSDYRWVTEQVADIARRHARGRMVSLLEGGYALGALGRSAVQHVRACESALADLDPRPIHGHVNLEPVQRVGMGGRTRPYLAAGQGGRGHAPDHLVQVTPEKGRAGADPPEVDLVRLPGVQSVDGVATVDEAYRNPGAPAVNLR